jgi:processive 1,2-diacylglycerol beta-glucosyltransferase
MNDGAIVVAGASSGWGHMQAALNLRAWLKRSCPACQVSVIDAYDYVSCSSRFLSKTMWKMLSLHSPALYSRLHAFLIRSPHVWRVSQEKQAAMNDFCRSTFGRRKVLAFIATHPTAIQLGSFVKRQSGCKLYVVSTDFVFHNLYCNRNVDAYFVPPGASVVGRVANSLRAWTSAAKLYEAGVPLAPEFDQSIDPRQARFDLRLDADRFTVLVSFGGAGLGFRQNIGLLARLIRRQPAAQWLLIAGRDRQLYDQLKRVFPRERRDQDRVRVRGFVQNMAQIIAAADVLIGKAGGLTVSEVLHTDLPIAIIDKLPGQEEYNAQVVLRNGLGIETKDVEVLSGWLRSLTDQTSARHRAQHLAPRVFRSGGAMIADQVLKDVEQGAHWGVLARPLAAALRA